MRIISLQEYFFPPRCALCNTLLSAGTPIYICKKCIEDIDYYNNLINSLNLPSDIETYCDGMVCVGRYSDSLKNSLKRFKFSNKPSYYRAFGKLLALKVENTLPADKIDLIIPVPLHRSRQNQRGYNQAELIAKFAGNILGIETAADVLVKISDSKSQSMLGREERLLNVEDLYQVVNVREVNKRNILIIDDIITTGSTINQCSKALKQAGADNVFAAVIATTRV